MMKMMKKLLCLSLVFAMLFASLAGCSDNASPSNDTAAPDTTAAPADDTAAEDGATAFIEPEIPSDADFGGEKFNIIYPEWSLYEKYLTTDELTGDVMNDALFNRTYAVEDRLNVDIEFITVGYIDTILTEVSNTVKTGDAAYDMAVTHCINGLIGLMTGGYLMDWNDIPHVNFSNPYWNQSINTTLTIDGITPFAASDMLIADPNVIYYNRDIADNNGLPDVYQMVRDGEWTLDKMIELSNAVVSDLNGDSKMNLNDQYGIIGQEGWPLISFLYGCDQYVTSFDESGAPVIALKNERTVQIVEKMYSLFCEGNRAFTSGVNDRYIEFERFHALFYTLSLSSMEQYRETEVNYGILPFPKLDTNQENYVSLNWTGLQCIPVTCKNAQMTGMVSELLASESRKQVLPAYFDVLLAGKIARDADTKEMLDIIFSTCVYDFGLNFSNQNDLLYIVPKLITAKSTDVASFVDKRIKPIQKQIDKVYEAYMEMK
jgi:hypothetical protein